MSMRFIGSHTCSPGKGRHDEAIVVANAAVDSDPLSILMKTNLFYILSDARRWEQAFEVSAAVLRRETYVSLLENEWVSNMRARRAEEAAEALQQWAVVTGRNVEAAEEVGRLLVQHIDSDSTGNLTESTIAKLQLRSELPEVYAALGDFEGTIQALQSAYEGGTGVRSLLSMRINPSFDFVRADPRFIDLLAKIGLEE